MAAEFSTSNERDALAGFLDQQRDALVRKIRGVDDADARRAPTVSSLSLLGLLKHSTVWEERWFQGAVAGRTLPDGWPERESAIPDEDFLVDDVDTVPQWVARYEAAAETSRQIVDALDLNQSCARTDVIDCNLRWVMLHLIEETARHAGHVDTLTSSGRRSTGVGGCKAPRCCRLSSPLNLNPVSRSPIGYRSLCDVLAYPPPGRQHLVPDDVGRAVRRPRLGSCGLRLAKRRQV